METMIRKGACRARREGSSGRRRSDGGMGSAVVGKGGRAEAELAREDLRIGAAGAHSGGPLAKSADSVDSRDPLADPAHDRNRHGVTERLVARAIGGEFAAVWNERVVVWEALEAFALARGQATDGGTVEQRGAGRDAISASRAKGRAYFARDRTIVGVGENDGRHNPCVRMALAMTAGAQRGREIAHGVCTVILGREGDVALLLHASFSSESSDRLAVATKLSHFVTAVLDEGAGNQVSGLALVVVCAACSNAVCSEGGNARPRFSARRRMPRQAVALKKYRCGTSPVSKTSDNEDATAALWNSEVLSVQNSVGEPIPEFDHPSEDGTKVPSSVRRQDAGDVLPDQPAGPFAISKAQKLKREVATIICQSASKAGDAERLAGGASDKKVNWPIVIGSDCGEVAMAGDIGIVVRQHGAREGFDLAERGGRPIERVPGDGRGLDAGADGEVPHHRHSASGTGSSFPFCATGMRVQ